MPIFPSLPTPRRALCLGFATLLALGLLLPAGSAFAMTPADVFISEYVEGGGNNKVIEIYNGTGAAIDLAAGGYELRFFFNGSSSSGSTIALTGTVADGDVYVVADNNSSAAILALTDQQSTASFFNGDDAIELRRGAVTLDIIGQIGTDPGSQWGTGDASTQNNTLRRMADICDGDTDGTDAFDPATEWDGFPQDNIADLGAHTANCGVVAPVINEFVFNHTGSDTSEFVEVAGAPMTDYSAFTVLEIEGDSAAGVIDGVFPVGTTNATGYWTTGFLNNQIENGSVTLLLVEGFSGSAGDDLDTDGDGMLDVAPWSALIDGVAISDGGGSDGFYATPVLTSGFDGGAFTVGGASRIPDATDTDAASDWTRNDFDGDGLPCCGGATADPGEAFNTPDAINDVAASGPIDPLINEFVANHTGTDTSEFIEIVGTASTDYSAYTVIAIEGDSASPTGTVDRVYAVGTTNANGYWTTGFLNNQLENGTISFLLVEGFSGMAGDDLDTDDDGTLDTTPWTRLVDDVAVDDGGASDLTYATVILDATFDGGSFTVGGASRIPDATDTDATTDWTRNDFDGDGLPCCTATAAPGEAFNTPDAVNGVAVAMGADPLLNEFVANHTGTDTSEFVEVVGDASADYSAFTVLAIEGDITSATGTVDRAYTVGVTNAAGYWTTGFVNNQLENGTTSFLLVEGFSGSTGDDLDTDDDGMFDVTPWTRVVDDVAVDDGTAGDLTYATVVLTAGFDGGSITVGGASRIPDGTDTDAASDWTRNDFDGDGLPCCVATAESGEAINTPDSINRVAVASNLVINEVDADTPGTDAAEFAELFDGGVGSTPLDGLVIVLFNGSSDTSYASFDLSGQSTDANGYFVIGNAGVSPDITFADNFLQNGADAVALYVGSAADFPNGTAVTTVNLLDALVYDTNDGDDAGLLALLNAGQGQINEAGGGASDTESNQRCPNGAGGGRNTDAYVQAAASVGATNTCVLPVSEIWEIQGSGDLSPVADTIVSTEDNIVTAVGPDGFFMQTPTVRSDGDPATSDGIFVFTGLVPTGVAVGDQVDVTGEVVEFFDFTEFSNNMTPLTVIIDSSGNPLPPAVVFDATTPSQDPTTLTCPTNNFECLEGMLVTVPAGVTSGPNQSFGSDPIAEIHIVTDGDRAFREPGIEFPGMAGLPVWDGNPEVLELDIDKLGLPSDLIPAGSTYSATGGLGFEFGDYEIWASAFSATPATLPLAVDTRQPGEVTLASLNFFRLFDDVDDPGPQDNGQVPTTVEYQGRLAKFSAYIRDLLDSPDVLAVQEVEKLGVLQDLAALIQIDDPSVVYTAHLIEGNDVGGIDVGYLTRDTVSVSAVTQLGAGEILTFDGSLLHDRPPLLLEADFTGNGAPFSFAILNNHTRSLSGIDDAGSGPRVRQKRLEQAQSIAQKTQDFQGVNPAVPLVVVGDLNAFQFTDGFVDVVGQIAGDAVPADNLLSGPDLVDPDLTRQVDALPPEQRYSFIFRGSSQVLDHALTAESMNPWVRGFQYARGNADAALILLDDFTTPLRSSDHDGFVLFLMTDFDADGVADDEDNCPFDPNSDQQDTDNDGTGDACDGDADGDTVADGTEDQAPNGGDGNGDGIADRLQSTVTSLPGSTGEYVTAITPTGCDVLSILAVDPASLPLDPEGFNLVAGLLEFELDCAAATVDLLFHGAPNLAGASYRKYGPEPTDPSLHWYSLAGAAFSSTMVGAAEVSVATLTLVDGGQGDAILTPDGRILDPGGPAFVGGTVAEIPTASDFGLAAIALLLAAAGIFRMRR